MHAQTSIAAASPVQNLAPHTPPKRRRNQRFRRWKACRETHSGAVCAGSNPAEGAGRSENSNTLTILAVQRAEPLTCGDARTNRILRPMRAPNRALSGKDPWSAALGDNGLQAVAAG